MFCPECGGEYRPGFTRCHDCDVALVDHLPIEGEVESPEMPAGDSEASGLVLLTEVDEHHFAAALAERFELESVGYVLQYGSAMEHVGGRQLVVGRRAVARPSWKGFCWVVPRDAARARAIAREVSEEQTREYMNAPFELPDED